MSGELLNPGPVADPKRPDIELPPGSCDAHFHVFGPADTFPYAKDTGFVPPDAPKQSVFELHRLLGIERGVAVQSSCHGTDHRAMLDLLAAGHPRYRGVALSGPGTDRKTIAMLDDRGVRGLRMSFVSHLGPGPGPGRVRELAELIRPFGWHLEVYVSGNGIVDLAALLRSLPVPVVIDHMARLDVSAGLDSEAVACLLSLLEEGMWVKISGADRVSKQGSPYRDAQALARLLVTHAPDRVVWGTDFPHPNISGPAPDDGQLVDVMGAVLETEEERRRVLVENPSALFGW